MNYQLDKNHWLLTTSNEVKGICSPLQKHFGIETFSYLNIKPDLSRIHLDTNPEWNVFFYRNITRYIKDSLTEANHWRSGMAILHTLNDTKCIRDSTEFDIGNGIVIANHKNNHTELVYFALDRSAHDSDLLNLINNQDLLQNFIAYFRDKAANLIELADKDPIRLPLLKPNAEIKEFGKNTAIKKAFLADIGYQPHPDLTQRELECLELTAQDLTAKEVGRILKISHRTVEQHIENMKSKLKCRNKSGLMKYYKHYYKYIGYAH